MYAEWQAYRNSAGEVVLLHAFNGQRRTFDSLAQYREWWSKDGGVRFPRPPRSMA